VKRIKTDTPPKTKSGFFGAALNLTPIKLPAPKFNKSLSLAMALKKRKTVREIGDKKITLQMLSNILWAACGVNRKNGPFGIAGRTAGSASNSQEIDVYVALHVGAYRYDPLSHVLIPALEEDIRALAIGPGQGRAGADAPVRFIYVVDIDKFNTAGFQEPGLYDKEIQKSYFFVDTGLIAQNVYLVAASQGLSAWFHNCNKEALAKKLKLSKQQRALFGQTIGYPFA